jgi:hypothetical protein
MSAYALADYSSEKIATGILYQDKERKCFSDEIPYRLEYKTSIKDEVKNYSISKLLDSFR